MDVSKYRDLNIKGILSSLQFTAWCVIAIDEKQVYSGCLAQTHISRTAILATSPPTITLA